MGTVGNPRPVIDSSLVLSLDSINQDSYQEVVGGNLVTNGNFDSDTAWYYSEAGIATISGNKLNCTMTAGNQYVSQGCLSSPYLKSYRITFTITDYTSGIVALNLGGYKDATQRTEVGTYVENFLVEHISSGSLVYIVSRGTGFVGSITNVIVEELSMTWTDLAGNNNGVLVNGTSYNYSDSSIVFDGVDDYVSVPHQSFFNCLPITIMGYVYRTSSTFEILNKYVSGSLDGYRFDVADNGLGLYYFANGLSQYITDYDTHYGVTNANTWYYVAVVVDGTGAYFYIDGVLVGSKGWIGAPSVPTTTQYLSIGNYPISAYSNGRVKNLQLYERALSVSEIKQNYNALKARKKFNATGGIITIVNGYKIHTFNSTDTFTTNMAGDVEVLVVAGGGGSGYDVCGGGGGGGLIHQSKFAIDSGNINVTVGNGGSYAYLGNNGENSIFGILTAIGGGGGSYYYDCLGKDGGCGGGGNPNGPNTNPRVPGVRGGGSGVAGQGYNGGSTGTGFGGCGGGGAGGIGGIQDGAGSPGGIGLAFDISGTLTYYAGGGGAGGGAVTSIGYGGLGGGGNGDGRNAGTPGLIANGTPNTGGGGGGDGGWTTPGNGGSGVVIIKYQI